MLIKDNTTYILHLFLRRENIKANTFAPVSFIVHTSKDKHYSKFINSSKYKKIINFEEINQKD